MDEEKVFALTGRLEVDSILFNPVGFFKGFCEIGPHLAGNQSIKRALIFSAVGLNDLLGRYLWLTIKVSTFVLLAGANCGKRQNYPAKGK